MRIRVDGVEGERKEISWIEYQQMLLGLKHIAARLNEIVEDMNSQVFTDEFSEENLKLRNTNELVRRIAEADLRDVLRAHELLSAISDAVSEKYEGFGNVEGIRFADMRGESDVTFGKKMH